jgi:type IV pilus assembly protein PilA
MKKQSGFTLIELLLVLAIIGIISAIAIPALLNQRARARDKGAVTNTASRVGELASQIDMLRDQQVLPANWAAALELYLTNTTGGARNPWAGSGGAPAPAVNVVVATHTGAVDKAAFDALTAGQADAGTLGQSQFGFQVAEAGVLGFCGGAVYLYTPGTGTLPGSQVYTNSVAVE